MPLRSKGDQAKPKRETRTASGGMRGPTLRDIAERVGVSQATVSAILNGGPNAGAFAQKTQLEVRKAAEALGYRINPLAQALRRKRSGVIGCMMFNQHDIYYARAAEVAERYAKEHGYGIAVTSMGYDFSRFKSCMSQMAAWRVEGLLIMLGGRSLPAGLASALGKLDVPYLIGDAEDGSDSPSVSKFGHLSGHLAMGHLCDLGHRHICVLGVNPSNLHSSERLRGAEELLAERGLNMSPELRISVPAGLHGPNAGYVCAELALNTGVPFSAALCLNDLLALGALALFRDRGVAVPDSCSLVGFDDLSLDADSSEENRLGRFLTPSLTTVRLPMQEICQEAMRRLLSRVQNCEAEASYRIERQPKLIVRDSTAQFTG